MLWFLGVIFWLASMNLYPYHKPYSKQNVKPMSVNKYISISIDSCMYLQQSLSKRTFN